jgi:hypothetical protein
MRLLRMEMYTSICRSKEVSRWGRGRYMYYEKGGIALAINRRAEDL